MFTKAALAALAAATLAVPAAASAQTYYAHVGRTWGGAQPYYAQYYGAPRGDYDRGWRGRFSGYPEFRGIEDHIRSEIQEGVRDDLIERDDARDLFGQLRDIRAQEAREFRVHGWNLPQDDRYRIRARLQQLDHQVDEIREEPED